MHTIGLIVFPGFQSLGLSMGTVFEHAQLYTGRAHYTVRLVSEKGGLVRSSVGYAVETHKLSTQTLDTVIVLGDHLGTVPSMDMLRWLRGAVRSQRRVAAMCMGAFILAEAGLLDGRRATTHWVMAQKFRARYPDVLLEEDRIYVYDSGIWTSAGMTAGIDLALALLEADLGADVARAVARMLVVYHRRGGGQSQFSQLLALDAKSDRVQTVLAHARAHLAEDLSVEALAEIAHLSPRQFSRVFREETGQTPAKAIERLRVEAAREMLESTRHPMEVIARETGFGDRERMRQSFLRAFGQSPQALQRVALGQRAAV